MAEPILLLHMTSFRLMVSQQSQKICIAMYHDGDS